MTELARLIDPAKLAESKGPRGLVEVGIANDLLGATVEITLPKRVRCADCEGGGCQRCNNSGAFRLPDSPHERSVRLELPQTLGAGVLLRVLRPCGSKHELEQVLFAVAEAEASDASVKLIDHHRSSVPSARPGAPPESASFSPYALLWSSLLVGLATLAVSASLLAR